MWKLIDRRRPRYVSTLHVAAYGHAINRLACPLLSLCIERLGFASFSDTALRHVDPRIGAAPLTGLPAPWRTANILANAGPLSDGRRSILHAVVQVRMGKESACVLDLAPHNMDYRYAAAACVVQRALNLSMCGDQGTREMLPLCVDNGTYGFDCLSVHRQGGEPAASFEGES
ncbi:hypothetical protein [Mycetohabitans sp. B46]|uniref:hypothetical protein n=1 Tax=Mycetohabitans sp. B46 TaxID=2772536 RepID=UPI00307E9667